MILLSKCESAELSQLSPKLCLGECSVAHGARCFLSLSREDNGG